MNAPGDAPDTNPGDGLCRTATGTCTLRAALEESAAIRWAHVAVIDGATGEPLPSARSAVRARSAASYSFTVDSTVDDVDIAVGDGVCATGSGACTLRAAVMEANAVGGADVYLPAGTYTLTLVGDEDLAAAGDLDVGTELHIHGAGAAVTIIDANHIDRAFQVGVVTSDGFARGDLSLDGVTIENGASEIFFAGAITLDHCAYTGNVGGIVGHGGLSISDGTFTDNGGGVSGTAGVHVFRSVFDRSGGILFTSDIGFTSSSVVDSLVTHASLRAIQGGYEAGGTISGSTIDDNDGGGFEGGLDSGSSITGSAITNNRTSGNGGGILETNCNPVYVSNSTISGNSAGGSGGGIYFDTGCTPGELQLVNATIVGNVADSDHDGSGDGGGIAGVADPYYTALMTNTLVSGNIDAGGEAPDCATTDLTSRGYNLIGVSRGCGLIGDLTGNLLDVDPLVGPLTLNGGLTKTHALLQGSPAIDAGGACTGSDQRGVARPQGSRCDIGAFEFACGNGVVDPGEECDDGNTANGDCCSASCRFETAGNACAADGSACTADVCDGSGACTHQVPMTAGCQNARAGRSTVQLKRGSVPARDSLRWTWTGGEMVSPGDLGDPLHVSAYTTCVIQEVAGAPALLMEIPAPAGEAWSAMGAGFRYRDRAFTDGLSTMFLRPGPAGHAKFSLVGGGPDLHLPTLGLSTPVIVRVTRDDAPTCWEATFSNPKTNDAGQFKGRSD